MKLKAGEWESHIKQQGKDETAIDVAEGELFYTVCTGKHDYIDVKTEFEADTLARLVRIENLLRKKVE